MKKRKYFKFTMQNGKKFVTPGFIVFFIYDNSGVFENTNAVEVGFTASKKVGNAVVRNRVKRRLKHLVFQSLNELMQNNNYPKLNILKVCLVARHTSYFLDFHTMKSEFIHVIKKFV